MSRSTLFIIIFVAIIAVTAYIWLNFSRPLPPEEGAGEEFAARLSELKRLKDLRLDTSVLQDPFFRSLELPQETPIPEVKIGRSNPFLPF